MKNKKKIIIIGSVLLALIIGISIWYYSYTSLERKARSASAMADSANAAFQDALNDYNNFMDAYNNYENARSKLGY